MGVQEGVGPSRGTIARYPRMDGSYFNRFLALLTNLKTCFSWPPHAGKSGVCVIVTP